MFILAYGKVFLVRKRGGHDHGTLYAMKVLKKASIVQKKKTAEHTMTERQVLESVRQSPFLVTLYYAFQTDAKLHLILGQFFQYFFDRFFEWKKNFFSVNGNDFHSCWPFSSLLFPDNVWSFVRGGFLWCKSAKKYIYKRCCRWCASTERNLSDAI